ncbi:MetQ/NlpA family ABC transporter substrate-binding protein [Amycolatopsis cynarae]|uniref:MetQ/NlpA family ABC transporter substrate-binding protein n=1 Tax=Amycolatopsis cynarae TaxID=2995223 RepID=A0ABY7BA47_9PSEU|nr:MetQ/NlpA family ABC transporter substrate-binding protein [Amycolatopsis sp. HUAS 11-8]WAL69240.1 MetQ/NlpA family ABC transporter substrate-binding protein [Amycolatopsis sp. HUAS 11-8]
MSSPNTPDPEAALPEKPGRGKGFFLGIAAVVIVAVLAVVLVVVNSGGGSADTAGRTTVRIGVTDASADYWKSFTELAAGEGIDVKLVNFSDYTQANPALSQGQLDLNLFQHILFLANYNVSKGDTLTPIGSTYVVPLSLYSRRHAALAEIPAGGRVAIPNDPTNQARALLVLQSAGLISLRGGGTVLSTPAEIDPAASKVAVTPVDASQTVAALPSVDAAIVNNNFALDAGLDPSKALFNDDPKNPSAEPYINAFVSRAQDKDNPVYLKLAALYRDPRVSDKVEAQSKNTAVLVDRSQAELAKILSRLEDTVRAAKK